MDLRAVLLAPVRVPVRLAQALDDLATIADRARRDPDPVEEIRDRVDVALAELDRVVAVARDIVHGGAELTATAQALTRVAVALDATGRAIHDGGQELTATAKTLDGHTCELIDGGERLTVATEQVEAHMRVFRAALPRMLEGLDTVEELEAAVETVADTVEPLQGAADRVGRVTRRLSRSG
jgi:hypothetical protein